MTTETSVGSSSTAAETPRAPGTEPPPPITPPLSSAERWALAEQYDLVRIDARPTLGRYLRDLASRGAFIRVMATSRAYARNQDTYLGQLWAVLTPILNAAVYVTIFGLLLQADRGLENSVAYIVIGVFLFRFVDQSVMGGAKSIAGRTNLIRSLHFPRAVLPISTVLSLLTTLVPTLAVMCVIVWLSGQLPAYPEIKVTWLWLLMPLAIVPLWIFNMGVAFVMARIVAITPDIENFMGFLMRFVMYGSGVIFPVTRYAEELPASVQVVIAPILEYQPVAVYLYLVRSCLTQEPEIPPDPWMWLWGVGWALLTFVVGFLVFWRGEERYGRD